MPDGQSAARDALVFSRGSPAGAAEPGLPLLRVANTGITAIIGADGQVLASLPLEKEGGLEGTLPPPHPGITVYARYGDLPFLIILLLAGFWCLVLQWLPPERDRYAALPQGTDEDRIRRPDPSAGTDTNPMPTKSALAGNRESGLVGRAPLPTGISDGRKASTPYRLITRASGQPPESFPTGPFGCRNPLQHPADSQPAGQSAGILGRTRSALHEQARGTRHPPTSNADDDPAGRFD